MSPGEVSVVIPTYNGSRFIREALESVFAQTLLPDEIIVVDDASTDGTAELVEQMASESPVPLRVIRLKENSGGPAQPMNVGIECGKCDYVALLDQDDLMDAGKLEHLTGLLNEHPKAGMAFGQYRAFRDDGELLNPL